MPYQAAKEIAATFCYDIRWALTPVFGNDFPDSCLHPNEPGFAKFFIKTATVQYCTQETNRFREQGQSYKVYGSIASSPVEVRKTHFSPPSLNVKTVKQRRARPADIESGYGTDTDRSDKYLCSPEVSPRTRFTPINRSQSPYSPRTADSSLMGSPVSIRAPYGLLTPTSAPCEYLNEGLRTKRTHSKVAFHDHGDERVFTRPQTAATVDSAHGSEVSGGDDRHTHDDVDAAEVLLSLCAVDNTMPPTKRTRRGSTF
jgi:hypothetical protein